MIIIVYFQFKGSIGGVCERRQSVQGTMKSLNCGIVTVINYQTRVAEAVSQITFAHEVGHNFGAEVRNELIIYFN